jgi:hypothetical protein
MTPEEKEQLYREFKERMFPEFQELIYLNIPTIMGNIIKQHMTNYKIRETIYSQHPEFKNHPNIVSSVLMQTEGNNTLSKPTDIIKLAIPEIERRIRSTKSLDMSNPTKRPNLSTHGEL